jgi:hypothetical protein
MSDRVQTLLRGMVGGLQLTCCRRNSAGCRDRRYSKRAEKGLTARAGRSSVLVRVWEIARQLPERAIVAMRHVHERWGPN